jgi:hypothetical protein
MSEASKLLFAILCALCVHSGTATASPEPEPEPEPEPATLYVNDFVVYTSSTTNMVVTGTMIITEETSGGLTAQKITWDLNGTDDACPTGNGNVCGIHIHTGTSCATHAGVGGHYYNVASDPWTAVRYDSTGSKSATTTAVQVITNLTNANVLGRVMVVHNSVGNGDRIACGVITDSASTTAAGSTAQLSSAMVAAPVGAAGTLMAVMVGAVTHMF